MKQRELTSYEEYYSLQNGRSGMPVNQTSKDDVIALFKNKGISIPETFYILDIGCRTGNLVAEFIMDGNKNTYGVDIGERAEQQWEVFPEHIRKNLMRADVQKGIPYDFKFDLIILSHVLEHVYDPDKTIDIVKSSLSSDGYLFIRVPMEYPKSGMSHKPHYTFFESSEDLVKFLVDKGFDAEIVQRRQTTDNEQTVICKLIKN